MADSKSDASEAAARARDQLMELGKAHGLVDPDIEAEPQLSARVRQILDHLPDDVAAAMAQRVSRQGLGSDVDIDRFADAHAVSPAERKLLKAVVEGATVGEYARSAGVSVNTVRTHMRRLLEKTGASSQVDLVRRVFRGAR